MVSVGIVGGSGYMGGEALRVLLRHPQADIAWVTRRSPGPVAARFLQAGARVIDLGAAFRLHERPTWERVYGQPHAAWSLVHEAVYGLPELHEERMRTARLIANPG